MKRIQMNAVIVAALVSISAVAFAQNSSLKTKLTAEYKKMCSIMKSNDMNKIEKYLMSLGTKDFKMVGLDGKAKGPEESMKEMKAQMSMVKSVKTCSMKLRTLKVNGNTAIATVDGVWEGVVGGEKPGETHVFKSVNVTEDTWVKVGSQWKVKRVKIVKDKMTMDGKPFDPSKMGG